MDAESASSVVARLKSDKVDYQLDEGGPHDSRAGGAGRRAAPGASRRRGCRPRPHRVRDLRPDRVRHHRVPRARQLPARARRRAGADDLARSARCRARACTSRWRRSRCSPPSTQPAKASVVLKLKGQQAAARRRPSPASPAWSRPASSNCGPSRSSSSIPSAARCPRNAASGGQDGDGLSSNGSSGSSAT